MLSHLASLCLCYHRIRQSPSFYSGTVASKSQKNENAPLISIGKLRFRGTGLHSNCQYPFFTPFAKRAWEANRKGFAVNANLWMIIPGITWLRPFRCCVRITGQCWWTFKNVITPCDNYWAYTISQALRLSTYFLSHLKPTPLRGQDYI